MGWVVNATPRTLYPGKAPVHIVQEAGWVRMPVWTVAENLVPTGTRSPDRPARSQSLYRLSYPGPIQLTVTKRNWQNIIQEIQQCDCDTLCFHIVTHKFFKFRNSPTSTNISFCINDTYSVIYVVCDLCHDPWYVFESHPCAIKFTRFYMAIGFPTLRPLIELYHAFPRILYSFVYQWHHSPSFHG
jgi:hypothetical protein